MKLETLAKKIETLTEKADRLLATREALDTRAIELTIARVKSAMPDVLALNGRDVYASGIGIGARDRVLFFLDEDGLLRRNGGSASAYNSVAEAVADGLTYCAFEASVRDAFEAAEVQLQERCKQAEAAIEHASTAVVTCE